MVWRVDALRERVHWARWGQRPQSFVENSILIPSLRRLSMAGVQLMLDACRAGGLLVVPVDGEPLGVKALPAADLPVVVLPAQAELARLDNTLEVVYRRYSRQLGESGMVARGWWLTLAVSIVMAAAAIGGVAGAASAGGERAQAGADGWTRLLEPVPGGAAKLTRLPIFVDPRWPDEKAVFVVRNERLMRTLDGGTTWSEVGPEPETYWRLTTFGGQRSLMRLVPEGVLRTTDDGSS
jgi:hypothetical protein